MDRYLREGEARGLAAATLARRRGELDRWGAWMKRRRPLPRLEAIGPPDLIAYVRARSAFHAKSTVAGTMSEMRGMGEFLVREGIWPSNPLRWLQGPRLDSRMRVPRRLGAGQMERLWRAASTHRSPYHRRLWTAVLGVLYGTGLRRGELVRLELSSWDRREGVLELDGRKTRRVRRVPLPALAAQCLEAYLPVRQQQLERHGRLGQRALFVSAAGERLSATSVSGAIGRLSRRAGLAGVTLHAFRHSCASDLLESGVGVAHVQQILGHQVLATTVRYLQVADPHRHAAMALHPINDWLAQEAA